ncbi:hypothetical protein [Pseudomonas viridiflava]|nr:hypothetical protein [Pseudomonas viridiflava]
MRLFHVAQWHAERPGLRLHAYAEPDDVAHNPTLSDLRRVANAR